MAKIQKITIEFILLNVYFLDQKAKFLQVYKQIISINIKFIIMNNPQNNSNQLSPRIIYDYDNQKNIPWNLTQYQTPAQHFDQKSIVRDRMYASQKKGVKVNDYYVTRRGFYMDYDLKVAKSIPSSVVHIDQNPWDDTKVVIQGDELKTARQSIKYTYLQRIEMKQKAHPVPGIRTYKLQKSPEQIQSLLQKNKGKKLSVGQKRYFHQNDSFLGDKVPGAGNYNPHGSVEKLHKSKADWKYWTKKDGKWQQVLSKRQAKIPAPGTYTPIYQSYSSFQLLEKKDQKQKRVKNGFGSDARFPYLRPNKKQIIQMRPSPLAYETKIDWKGKNISPSKKQWVKMIWKGSPPKVYN